MNYLVGLGFALSVWGLWGRGAEAAVWIVRCLRRRRRAPRPRGGLPPGVRSVLPPAESLGWTRMGLARAYYGALRVDLDEQTLSVKTASAYHSWRGPFVTDYVQRVFDKLDEQPPAGLVEAIYETAGSVADREIAIIEKATEPAKHVCRWTKPRGRTKRFRCTSCGVKADAVCRDAWCCHGICFDCICAKAAYAGKGT